MDPEALYVQLGRLIEAMPDLKARPLSTATMQWIGRAYALVQATSDVSISVDFGTAKSNMDQYPGWAAERIQLALYGALAVAELRAPATAQGSFIPAGNAFDALTAVGKVLQSATGDALIVDPYMDEKVLTDFAPLASDACHIRLLADEKDYKAATLKPAAERWVRQYLSVRKLSARLAPARSLHDRLIVVDNATAYVLTQSLNAFAARAPATIVRVDDETARLKIGAYNAMWSGSKPL